MMQYCENCMAMKQSVALVDNNNIKKMRKNMDNNTNRINSLNANRLNSQTSNGRAQSRTHKVQVPYHALPAETVTMALPEVQPSSEWVTL